MKEVVFDKERKGYDPTQVEQYIKLLQDKYSEAQNMYEELHRTTRDLEKDIADVNPDALRQQYSSLNNECTFCESDLKVYKERLTEEKTKCENQQKELESKKKEQIEITENEEHRLLTKEIEDAKQETENLRKEIEELKNLQGEDLEAVAVSGGKEVTGFERLQHIFEDAKLEAEKRLLDYQEEIDNNIASIKQESVRILEEGESVVKQIKEEKSKLQQEEITKVREAIQKLKEDYAQEKQDLLDKCDEIRQQAAKEKVRAREEAALLEKLTQEVHAGAKDKEESMVNEVYNIIEENKRRTTESFAELKENIRETVNTIESIMKQMKCEEE